MSISLKEIAKLANCSTATVSYVLNGKDVVRKETKDRIMKIIREQKYVPSHLGRILRTGKSEIIGITFCRQSSDVFSHPYYLLMMGAFERVMAEHGYEIILSEYNNTLQESKALPPFLSKGKVDGMIVLGGFPKETIKLFTESTKLPILLLDTYADNASCVIVDNKKAMKNAMLEISKLGHKHANYFGFSLPDYNTEMRIQGFIEGITEYGFDKSKCKIYRNFARLDTGVSEFKKMLELGDWPSVIVSANDNIAIALMDAAKEMGIDVPTQMSFVGFDDTQMAKLVTPQLTTIRTEIAAMGKMAANIMLQKMKDKNRSKTVEIFESSFVLRQSLAAFSS